MSHGMTILSLFVLLIVVQLWKRGILNDFWTATTA